MTPVAVTCPRCDDAVILNPDTGALATPHVCVLTAADGRLIEGTGRIIWPVTD